MKNQTTKFIIPLILVVAVFLCQSATAYILPRAIARAKCSGASNGYLRPVSFLERENNAGLARARQEVESALSEATAELRIWGDLAEQSPDSIAYKFKGFLSSALDALRFRQGRLRETRPSERAIESAYAIASDIGSKIAGIRDFRRYPINPRNAIADIGNNLRVAKNGALPKQAYAPDMSQAIERTGRILRENGIEFDENTVFVLPQSSWVRDIFGFTDNINGLCVPMSDQHTVSHYSFIDSSLGPNEMAHVMIHERLHAEFEEGEKAMKLRNPKEATLFHMLNEGMTEILALEASGENALTGAYPEERKLITGLCGAWGPQSRKPYDVKSAIIGYLKTGNPAVLQEIIGENAWDLIMGASLTWQPYVDFGRSPIFPEVSFTDYRIPAYRTYLYGLRTLLSGMASGETPELTAQKLALFEKFLRNMDRQRMMLAEMGGELRRAASGGVEDYARIEAHFLMSGGIKMVDAIAAARDSSELQNIAITETRYKESVYSVINDELGLKAPECVRIAVLAADATQVVLQEI